MPTHRLTCITMALPRSTITRQKNVDRLSKLNVTGGYILSLSRSPLHRSTHIISSIYLDLRTLPAVREQRTVNDKSTTRQSRAVIWPLTWLPANQSPAHLARSLLFIPTDSLRKLEHKENDFGRRSKINNRRRQVAVVTTAAAAAAHGDDGRSLARHIVRV